MRQTTWLFDGSFLAVEGVIIDASYYDADRHDSAAVGR